jgi:hypothetical protein
MILSGQADFGVFTLRPPCFFLGRTLIVKVVWLAFPDFPLPATDG